jgi:carbonic anhydrase
VSQTFRTLGAAFAALLLFLTPCGGDDDQARAEAEPAIAAPEALALLKAGNERFVANMLEHPHQSAQRRTEVAAGQHPIAAVLGCADSRTAPEVVFDQGLGDVFVVRVAGNVVNDDTLGSLEYAVEHFGLHLIVVLGHEHCGAVEAARETIAAGSEAHGHLKALVRELAPAVEATRREDAEATERVNVLNVAQALRDSDPILHDLVTAGKLTVVGAYYDLDTGKVSFLKDGQSPAKGR